MFFEGKRILAFFLCAALGGGAVLGDETGDERPASKVKSALDQRLRSLDGEERELKDFFDRLKNGEKVNPADLLKIWLPPALGIVESKQPFDALEVTEDAAEIASDMLEDRKQETEDLELLKARIHSGDAVKVGEVFPPGELGLDGKLKILEAEARDLNDLRRRLEELLFDQRFNQAADLKTNLDGEGDPDAGPEFDPLRLEGEDEAPEEVEPLPEIDIQKILDAPQGVDRFALAEALYRTGRYGKAKDVFEQIDRASHAQGDRVLYMIGRCLERLDDFDGALNAYQQVDKGYPESFWAKQSKFAARMVEWKKSLGPIQGTPEEAYRVLRKAPKDGVAGGGEVR